MPGLKVVEPSTPQDVKGMLLAAIADPDPVIVFEHKLLYKMKGVTPEGYYETPLDRAVVRREGRDLTIVATAIMVHRALEAADDPGQGGDRGGSHRPALLAADRQGRDRGQRQDDRAAARGLRRRQDARHRGGNLAPSSPRARRSTISTRRSCGSAASRRRSPIARSSRRPPFRKPTTSSRRRARLGARRGLTLAVEIVLPRVDMDMSDGPDGALVCRRGRACRQGRDAVRDRNRQGGDGGRGAGLRRA